MKKLTKSFKTHTMIIKDSIGKKLIEPEEISQRWKEYCEKLYDNAEDNIEINIQENEPPPLKDEIRGAISKMSNRKAPEPGNTV